MLLAILPLLFSAFSKPLELNIRYLKTNTNFKITVDDEIKVRLLKEEISYSQR